MKVYVLEMPRMSGERSGETLGVFVSQLEAYSAPDDAGTVWLEISSGSLHRWQNRRSGYIVSEWELAGAQPIAEQSVERGDIVESPPESPNLFQSEASPPAARRTPRRGR